MKLARQVSLFCPSRRGDIEGPRSLGCSLFGDYPKRQERLVYYDGIVAQLIADSSAATDGDTSLPDPTDFGVRHTLAQREKIMIEMTRRPTNYGRSSTKAAARSGHAGRGQEPSYLLVSFIEGTRVMKERVLTERHACQAMSDWKSKGEEFRVKNRPVTFPASGVMAKIAKNPAARVYSARFFVWRDGSGEV
jgi:hypothetical protein